MIGSSPAQTQLSGWGVDWSSGSVWTKLIAAAVLITLTICVVSISTGSLFREIIGRDNKYFVLVVQIVSCTVLFYLLLVWTAKFLLDLDPKQDFDPRKIWAVATKRDHLIHWLWYGSILLSTVATMFLWIDLIEYHVANMADFFAALIGIQVLHLVAPMMLIRLAGGRELATLPDLEPQDEIKLRTRGGLIIAFTIMGITFLVLALAVAAAVNKLP